MKKMALLVCSALLISMLMFSSHAQTNEGNISSQDAAETALPETQNDKLKTSAEGNPADASHLVTITGVNVYIDHGNGFEDLITHGARVPCSTTPTQGDSIRIEYTWEISRQNIGQIQLDSVYMSYANILHHKEMHRI